LNRIAFFAVAMKIESERKRLCGTKKCARSKLAPILSGCLRGENVLA
jgi:hypothetical protein